MIKKIIKTLTNSALLVVLLGILVLPIGFMGIINFQEKSTVLSAEDIRKTEETVDETQPRSVPKDVEDVIMRLEREYYQSTESAEEQP